MTTEIGNQRILVTLFGPPAVAETLQTEITCEVALALRPRPAE
jgi:hypothetical protein